MDLWHAAQLRIIGYVFCLKAAWVNQLDICTLFSAKVSPSILSLCQAVESSQATHLNGPENTIIGLIVLIWQTNQGSLSLAAGLSPSKSLGRLLAAIGGHEKWPPHFPQKFSEPLPKLQLSANQLGKQRKAKKKHGQFFPASQANASPGDLAGTCKGGDRVWVPATFETGTHKEVVNKNRDAKCSEKTRTWGNFSYN